MSISMKALQLSDDEEEEENDNFQDESITSLAEDMSDGEAMQYNATAGKNIQRKSWLKDQVSDSFKKISTKISPLSSSLDSHSLDENASFDSHLEAGSPAIGSLPKVCSETDLSAFQESSSYQKESLSKREWFKGQFNNYLSKSKNYYNNRNSTGSVNNDSLAASSADIRTESPEIKVDQVEDANSSKAESSLNSSNTSLDDKHLKQDSLVTKNTFTKGQAPALDNLRTSKPKIVTSKLKFSDLLHSNSSLSSPTESQEEITLSPKKSRLFKGVSSDEDYVNIEIDHLTNQIVKEDLKHHLRPNSGTDITFFKLWLATLFMFGYFVYPLPAFLSGMVTGSLSMYLIGCAMVWLMCPSAEIYDQYRADLKNFLISDLQNSNKPEGISTLPNPQFLAKPRDLKGWMFLAYTYDDVFEKRTLKDVYAVIHEDTLFLFISKNKLEQQATKSKKKKTKQSKADLIEEPGSVISFELEIRVDLANCVLELKPDSLPIRRIWSKKYPMKLEAPNHVVQKKKIDLSLEDLTMSMNDIIEGIDLSDNPDDDLQQGENTVIFLFGNTGREKEDWFYRMQLCVKPLKHQVTCEDIRLGKLSDRPATSYPHYMIELISESEKVMQRTANGKKMEPYLAWLNIFLGRAFWDFWHDKYWTDKLHQKIQSRLSKINAPPFITDIKLKDLNCGHNIPIIHKGSKPVLDEYGIWTDLQISYKGYFTLTLETQLNVDYYVELVSSIVKQKAGISKDNAQLNKMTKLSEISSESNEELDVDSVELENPSELEDLKNSEEVPDVYFDAYDHVDGNEEGHSDMIDPVMSDPRTKKFLESKAGKKVVGLVGWLAKSKLAKKVAETDFAKKAYGKAYEKFRKMPIILKVEIQSLKGNLAVNIPPPPTNRLWFGFRNNPVIFITATPKVGDKQVKLNYLTNWIERKLKEEFKKVLVLPSMQDISIKLMDSQLKEFSPDRPSS